MNSFRVFNLKKVLQAAFYILLPVVLGFVVTQVIGETDSFYKPLQKPPLAPPPIVFPIVWTVLYLLMGIASYLVRDNKTAMFAFYLQLAMNYAWVFLFFGFHLIGFSVFWLILLIIATIITTVLFWQDNKTAGILMLPYNIWLFIALYLNAGIAILN